MVMRGLDCWHAGVFPPSAQPGLAMMMSINLHAPHLSLARPLQESALMKDISTRRAGVPCPVCWAIYLRWS